MTDIRTEINGIECMPTYLLGEMEHKNFTYEEYVNNLPMRDGEEISIFLDELNNEE